MQALVLIVVVVVLLALCLALSYNRFARQRQLLLDAWSGVDTELRRRHDLVPNLTAVVKGYAAHERSTFESVAAARALTTERPAAVASPTVGSAGAASAPGEEELGSSLRSLLAVAEAYPELEADQQFLDLQRQLVVTEDRIQAAASPVQRQRAHLQPAGRHLPVAPRGPHVPLRTGALLPARSRHLRVTRAPPRRCRARGPRPTCPT